MVESTTITGSRDCLPFLKSPDSVCLYVLEPIQSAAWPANQPTPQFIKGIKQAGFNNISPEELVRCRDHGVTSEYIQKLRSRGVQNLTIDQIIRLRDHGIEG